METRMDIFQNPVTNKFLKYFARSYRVVTDSSLPRSTVELVSLRASQINGCGFCVDMHTKEAAHEGETPVRLAMVAAWREATVFSDAERAALELTEQGTRIADGAIGVTDEAWTNATKHYDENELAALVSLIAFMNSINRVNVITKQHGGNYQIGQLSDFT
jgi:AhpD family alkylhydroperoxidase